MDITFRHISELDQIIQSKEPFKLVKTDKDTAIEIIKDLVLRLYAIAGMLHPMMPETSKKIKETIKAFVMPEPLFLRKE
jgi:methionyl-tRNA synthetase